MSVGSDAADQLVREGVMVTESAIKLAGLGAKNLAALLLVLLREHKKLKGRTGINKLIDTDKPLSIFHVKRSDLGQFKTLAKDYGVLYTPIYNAGQDKGICDVLVRSDDAARVNRILEIMKYPEPERQPKNVDSRVLQEHRSTERGSGFLNRQIERRRNPVRQFEGKTSALEALGAKMLAALCLQIAAENAQEKGASELSKLFAQGQGIETARVPEEYAPAITKQAKALNIPIQLQELDGGACTMFARRQDAPIINQMFRNMGLPEPLKPAPAKNSKRRNRKKPDQQRTPTREKVEQAKAQQAAERARPEPQKKREAPDISQVR